jgi:signal transduction histidine kinase
MHALLLIALAAGSALLLQRWDSIEQSRHNETQARAQVELIAYAAQPLPRTDDPHRLLRILECSVRSGYILAGAVMDSSGVVVAHTDLSSRGKQIDVGTLLHYSGDSYESGAQSALFGDTSGRLFVRPLFSEAGESGAAAVLMPDNLLAGTARGLMISLFPVALVLLAFSVVNRSAIRGALTPAAEGLDRLAHAVGWQSDPERPNPVQDVKYDEVIDGTVTRIEDLTRNNDELMVTNRLYEFENHRMKMILDHFPEGLIVMDVIGKTAFINKRASRILGIPSDGDKAWSPEEPPVEVLRTIREIDKTGQVLIPFGEGEAQRQILCSRIPLSTPIGKPMGTLYAMRDVTAQSSAVRAQAGFLSQITHELKSPLNTVLAYTEMLAEGSELDKEEQKEFHNTLTSEAHRMGQLINNLMQLSRIQMGDLSARFSLVKPGALLKDQVESIKIQAEDSDLKLDINVPDNLPTIRGDKDLLGVAVTNLISNALKYTQAGGKISVRAIEDEEGIVFNVQDTGIGISEESLPRIFDRFFRSEDEAVQERPGSGLGLALVKEIVELHNGRITVASTPGSGTLFQIWLPAPEITSRLNATEALT